MPIRKGSPHRLEARGKVLLPIENIGPVRNHSYLFAEGVKKRAEDSAGGIVLVRDGFVADFTEHRSLEVVVDEIMHPFYLQRRKKRLDNRSLTNNSTL